MLPKTRAEVFEFAKIYDLDTHVQYKFPLHYACMTNNLEVVITLCELGANVELGDVFMFGQRPIEYAAENGNCQIVEYLLGHHNVDTRGSLFRAAKNGYIDIVEYIIKVKPEDVNKLYNSHMTPLMVAIREKHIDIVDKLLSVATTATTATNVTDCVGNTCLFYAIENINKNPDEPYTILDRLISSGIDLKHKNNYEQTVRKIAENEKNVNLVKYLDNIINKKK